MLQTDQPTKVHIECEQRANENFHAYLVTDKEDQVRGLNLSVSGGTREDLRQLVKRIRERWGTSIPITHSKGFPAGCLD